tara:strand:+ start:168 stop:386 length:219 start_codon:yes stop_codon:yes gene_type:complete
MNRALSVTVAGEPPDKFDACVGLVKIGRWGVIKECWNTGKSKPLRWYYYFIPMRFISWDRNGAFLGRSKKRI